VRNRIVLIIPLAITFIAALFLLLVSESDDDGFAKSGEFFSASIHERCNFSNGYFLEENVQHHIDNLADIENIINSELANNIPSASLDSLHALNALLHYYLWETYQASYSLCYNIETDLYAAPPIGVNNPNLPLMFTKGLSTTAIKFIESNFSVEHFQDRTRSGDLPLLPDCSKNVSSGTPHDMYFVQNDSGGIVFDLQTMLHESCFHKFRAVTLLEDYLSEGGRLHDIYQKKLLLSYLYENTDNLKKSARSNTLAVVLSNTFRDSIGNDSYSALIFELVGKYIQNEKMNKEEAIGIIQNSNYLLKNKLFELLVVMHEKDPNTFGEFEDNLIYKDFLKNPHPTLTPLHVLKYAIHQAQSGNHLKASELINEFWYSNANNHPATTWWFDNYPKYLLESYTMGRLDGSRLPMWLDDYFEIIGDDSTLSAQSELLKYYNVCVFYNPSSTPLKLSNTIP
jgi:hypothetical protein